MRLRIPVTLFALALLSAPLVQAAEGGFTLGGSFGFGGQYIDLSDTVDEGKLREYRDMTDGLLTLIDLRGHSSDYYLNLFAENLGRKDMFIDLRGGSYGSFKYQLTSDSMQHFFTTDARTPYAGHGTLNQTAVLPRLDPSTWNVYDLAYKRRNDGVMAEFSFHSPWYVRADYGQVSFDGNKLQAYAQGTGSGNGFVDLETPVDFKTTNLSFEGGYSSRKLHFALAYFDSQFENDQRILRWTNGYFGNNNPPATSANLGIDTSYLPFDNGLKRWSVNGSVKLPLASTLSLRYTQSESTSDVTLGTSQLIGSASTVSTAPFIATPGVFKGKVKYDTWAASWAGSLAKSLDFRLYANALKRENESSHVVFSGFVTATNSLGCVGVVGGTGPIGEATGPRVCITEPFGYERANHGAEVAWRPTRGNRLSAGYDFAETEREFHPDSDDTEDTRYTLEWRNSSWDKLVASLRYQRLERRSNFLSPALPNTVWSFDVADMDRDIYKVGLDFSPTAILDFGAEYYYKKSKYPKSPAGRTDDDRDELYFSIGLGKSDGFRVKAYVDFETATTDARLVSRNNTTGAINFTVFTDVEDEFTGIGLGFDWKVGKKLAFAGSGSWNESKGSVDFAGLAGAQALPTTLIRIPNFGNNEFLYFNFKGTFELAAAWSLVAGLAYEDVAFDDLQFDPYSYVLPTIPLAPSAQGTASYLSGWYRDPEYTATVGYVMVTYKF